MSQKISGTKVRHGCGCVTDDIKYLDWCEAHRREHEETHARWAEEHGSGETLLAEERL